MWLIDLKLNSLLVNKITHILTVVLSLVASSHLYHLFIYYRKEPEIKATSYTLSLCMFVGCYLLLTSALFHNITSGTTVYGSQESLRTFIYMYIWYHHCGHRSWYYSRYSDCKDRTYLRLPHLQNIWYKVSSFLSWALFLWTLIVMLIAWATLDATYIIIDKEQFVSIIVPPFFTGISV